jgi:osmotically-inducible protein OsmY
MKNNEELQKDVQDAIKWEPLLSAAEIGVIARDGIITLTGTVNSYLKKSEAERAAKKVAGVKAVVEKIEINFGDMLFSDDNEIASAILNTFKWNWEIPNNKLQVKVESGWVTVEGELMWNFQKKAAENAIMSLNGVKGVTNSITIKTESLDEVEKKDIKRALNRNWSLINQDIQVYVLGNNVKLNGKVNSWYQKEEADRIAWNAPGVFSVENELVVELDN